MGCLTPASLAMGFPSRLSSVSSSAIVFVIRDWSPGILDLITCSRCCINTKGYKSKSQTSITCIYIKEKRHTFESIFPKYSDPILEAMCLYSGVVAKYSRFLRLAAIMSTFLLISCWDRLTTPTHGVWRR